MLTSSSVQKRLFLLSGEDSTIPLGELEALIQTYSKDAEIQLENRRLALVEGDVDPTVVSRRAACIRLGGIYIGSVKPPIVEEGFRRLDFTVLPKFKSFAARIYSLTDTSVKMDLEATLGHAVKEKIPSATVSLKAPDMLVVGVCCEDRLHVCGVDAASTRRSWKTRRPRARPFFHPSALYSKFARLLVNLTHVREGEVLLDPFCGTGSVLIEAGFIGVQSIGVDISRRMCRGALSNLKHYKISDADIVAGDATRLPLLQVDGAATDIPYGRSSSTHKREVGSIAEDLLDELGTVLPKDRYACIVHPEKTLLPFRRRFEKVQEHKIYVHRALTRTVTLLRRV